jgi:hypothetical protein
MHPRFDTTSEYFLALFQKRNILVETIIVTFGVRDEGAIKGGRYENSSTCSIAIQNVLATSTLM